MQTIVLRIVVWLLRGLGVLYVLQLVCLLYWEFVPIRRLEFKGVRYELYRGYGFPLGLFPLVGIFSLTDDPVRLVITNKTGEKEVKQFEHPQDLRAKNIRTHGLLPTDSKLYDRGALQSGSGKADKEEANLVADEGTKKV